MPSYRPLAFFALLALSVAAAAAPPAVAPPALSRYSGEGHTRDDLREYDGRAVGDLDYVPGVVGRGFRFNGRNAAVSVPDLPALRFTGSVTLSAWVRAEAYPDPDQGYAQLIFRGDDRGGLDPYFLGLNSEGLLVFGVDSGSAYADVRAPLPLDRFVHVIASLDDASGCMRLFFDGRMVAQTTTRVRPLRDLDPNAHPGIGLGNHAGRPSSQWNQPFTGILDEITLSDETTLRLRSLALDREAGDRATGAVRLEVPAPPGGAEVTLVCARGAARHPRAVQIPPGETTAAFSVELPERSAPVTLVATYNGFRRTATLE